jgi:hypothetical protein
MKVHIGCGAVYLRDYLNVDVPTVHTHLAYERPDLVERYITTDDAYYARHQDKTVELLSKGPLKQEYVCDRYGSFTFLPFYGSHATEILTRHSFEHLSLTEARAALDNMRRHLVPGGMLRIDVPDHNGTLKLYADTKDPFWARHLFGPQRGDYGFHVMSYTPELLRRLAGEHGFYYDGMEDNIHELYPAFCMRFFKPEMKW